MITQKEVVDLIKSDASNDMLGTARGDLLCALDFEHAKEFLKPDTTAEQWNAEVWTLKSDDDVLHTMREYMDFAWEKANNCRGISAMRSMRHYWAWLKLLGQDLLAEQTISYNHYGKDQLVVICALLGLDSSKWDDGVRK
jgi:hypothetical protein